MMSMRRREGMVDNVDEQSRWEWLVMSMRHQEGKVSDVDETSRGNGW